MLSVETQKSRHFEDLSAIQFGWDFTASQLGPCEQESTVSLYRTPKVGYNRFRYATPYDQRLRSRQGYLSFGLLDPENPVTWAYDQLIPNDAITVFSREEDLKAASPIGFRGNGIHFSLDLVKAMAEEVYRRPLDSLVPEPGVYLPDSVKIRYLRHELQKWQQLEIFSAEARTAIISRREETLALAFLDALADTDSQGESRSVATTQSMSRALEFIHNSELENISALELCRQSGCSQRTLEKGFKERFGVTPKKYIKYLRLARVRRGLQTLDSQDSQSVIQVAGIHGFWHMGQFAADYRRIYGELPSQTLHQKAS